MVVAQQVPYHVGFMWVRSVLTIAKLKRWSINYYIDTVATLVGLTDGQRVGGEAHAELVARWLDDGLTPNGAHRRAFGKRGVHGFDLTFCAPKSVSLVRLLRTDDVVAKAVADAHTTALAEATEFLAAHAGYTLTSSSRHSAIKAPSRPHGP
jgi:hypothetical protein